MKRHKKQNLSYKQNSLSKTLCPGMRCVWSENALNTGKKWSWKNKDKAQKQ